MKVYVTQLSNFEKRGLRITEPDRLSPAMLLLGFESLKQNKRQVVYMPEKFNNVLEITSEFYLKEYFRRSTHSICSIWLQNLSKIEMFLNDYSEFIKNNPEFLNKPSTQYKPPFKEPKKKKKLINGVWTTRYRIINEPKEELKLLQERAANLIIDTLLFKEAEPAHGYVKTRSNITNAIPHQKSKKFLQYDLKDFFPSITKELIKTHLHSLNEFAIIKVQDELLATQTKIIKNEYVKPLAEAILNLAMYKGGLPQGSPLSPVLTNIIMYEFDTLMQKYCKTKDASSNVIMYTRYADDLTFSSFKGINIEKMTEQINNLLPSSKIRINSSKTKYHTIGQKIYITGVKISADNTLNYGSEKKDELKRDIFQTLIALKEGITDLKESQILIGKINYARQINPKHIDLILKRYCRKFNIPVKNVYKLLTK